MNDGDFPIITPKRNWTKRQWAIYRKMPRGHRWLANLMVLAPGVSRRLAARALRYERWRNAHNRRLQAPQRVRLEVGTTIAPRISAAGDC
jgi:hypothetical protein